MKMTKQKTCFLILAVALLGVLMLLSSGFAKDFMLRDDGGVEVNGQNFASLDEYVNSDYFRKKEKRCGVRIMGDTAQFDKMEKSYADCTRSLTQIQNEYWPSVVYTIPVWWHVIYRSDGVGNIPTSIIEAQMQVLNEDFGALAGSMGSNGFDVKIQFELAGITRTMNNGWFTDSPADEYYYKTALSRDTKQFLNIYTNDAAGFLGYAYLPQTSAGNVYDGVVMLYRAVGGRNNSFYPYNQGRTLVHEVGHYLGLYHTFQDSTCSNTYSTGDLIFDTNAENTPHFGCSQTFTCGTADPIKNYMNYTDDICMNRFSAEQANRAVCSLVNYRPNGFSYEAGAIIPPFLIPLILE